MAFCDLEKYYSALKNNYFSMLHILEQYDEGRKTGAVTDKEFKKFKKRVDKIKESYETMAYFFMLWSKPTKTESKGATTIANKALKEEKAKGTVFTKEEAALWKAQYQHSFNYLQKRDPDKMIKRNKKLLQEIKAYVEKLEESNNG